MVDSSVDVGPPVTEAVQPTGQLRLPDHHGHRYRSFLGMAKVSEGNDRTVLTEVALEVPERGFSQFIEPDIAGRLEHEVAIRDPKITINRVAHLQDSPVPVL